MKAMNFIKTLLEIVTVFIANATISAAKLNNNLIYNAEEVNGVKVAETVYKMDNNLLTKYMKYNYKYDANDQRDDIADQAAHDKANIACRSSDSRDGIEVGALENTRHHAHKTIAQHAAAYRGKKAHHDAHDRCKSVHERLICAGCRINTHRDDVEQGDELVGLVDDGREDVDDGRRGDGQRKRHGLVKDVDVAHLERHIAQKTAAQTADHGERDGAHQIEFVLARNQYTRNRRRDDSEHLEPKRDGNHGIRGVCGNGYSGDDGQDGFLWVVGLENART